MDMCGEGSDAQAESSHVVDRAGVGIRVLFGMFLVTIEETIEEDVAGFGKKHTIPSRRSGVG
jgi:hypothetical protein